MAIYVITVIHLNLRTIENDCGSFVTRIIEVDFLLFREGTNVQVHHSCHVIMIDPTLGNYYSRSRFHQFTDQMRRAVIPFAEAIDCTYGNKYHTLICSERILYFLRCFRRCGHRLSRVIPTTRATHKEIWRSMIHAQQKLPDASINKNILNVIVMPVNCMKSVSASAGSINM